MRVPRDREPGAHFRQHGHNCRREVRPSPRVSAVDRATVQTRRFEQGRVEGGVQSHSVQQRERRRQDDRGNHADYGEPTERQFRGEGVSAKVANLRGAAPGAAIVPGSDQQRAESRQG